MPCERLANQLEEQLPQPPISVVLPEPTDHLFQQLSEPRWRMPPLEAKQQRHQARAPRQLVLGKGA